MTRTDFIKQIAQEAGQAILSIVPDSGIEEKLGRGNYVTAGDKKSESIIVSGITTHFPQDIILSEETESKETETELLGAPHLWIIDPIDGTANFRYQRKYSAVSIGYAEYGQLMLGIVYDPFRNETYYAKRNEGAFHNGIKVKINTTNDIHSSIIITDNSYNAAITRQHIEALLKIPETPWLQMKGSAALELCEVAAGQADLFFSFCLNPWDTAAGYLMIEEAGGIITNKIGTPVNFFSPEIIAGNKIIVQQFISTISSR